LSRFESDLSIIADEETPLSKLWNSLMIQDEKILNDEKSKVKNPYFFTLTQIDIELKKTNENEENVEEDINDEVSTKS